MTAPSGFRASGLHCGIKASGKPDLSLIVSDTPAAAGGVFTINLAKAAPIYLCQHHLASSGGRAKAIVTNSGCANACTGPQGVTDAKEMARLTAAAVGCPEDQVLVASTGVIGVNLKMDKIRAGIPLAVKALAADGGALAARAIMTTDPFPKEHAVTVTTPRGTFSVGGTAKGSGMIEPLMATMLGVVSTDAAVEPGLLARALKAAAADTFNAITVDGECSTNDTLFAMASGSSGVAIDEDSYPALLEGFLTVSRKLAVDIVRGGEGATKLIRVTVHNARTLGEARQVARTIANSPLVKTAVHGADPNWGRIVAAAGRSGAQFDIERATVRVGGVLLFENGLPHDDAAPQAAEHMKGKDVDIDVDLGTGAGVDATIWTCDLSAEYVRINGEYRT